MSELTIITLIIMLGILFSVVAWQIFSVSKMAVRKEPGSSDLIKSIESIQEECRIIRKEVKDLHSKLKGPKS
jgi:hypothetical protein